MADPIVEELALDIDPALADIGRVDDALQQVAAGFKVALADAIQVLSESVTPPEIDTSQITTELEGAIAEASDTPVLLDEVDATAVGAALDTEIAAAQGTAVLLEGDASQMAAAIDEVTVAQTIDIDADVTAAQEAIAALATEPISVEVDTTSSGADQQGLQDELGQTAAAANSATGELAGLAAVSTLAGGAAGVAKGEVSGLASSAGLLGGNAGIAATGIAAIGGAAFAMAKDALDAEAATFRFHQTFGLLADDVNQIDVGTLNVDLSELALSLGSDDDALRNVASSFFLFQRNAGAAAPAAAKVTEEIVALAARAVALNPALGNVEDVADRMGRALARGGRFASEFQISLSPVEIRAKAAANAAQGLGDGVSFAALQMAGAQLATEKYGKSLDTDIAKGIANPLVQLRSLTQGFKEATEQIGKPVIAPILDTLREAIPIGVDVAEIVASLAQAGLPALEGFLEVLGAILHVLEPVLDLLGAIPDPVYAAAGAFIAAQLAVKGLIALMPEMAAVSSTALGPIGLIVSVVGALVIGFQALGDKSKQAAPATAALAEQLTKVRDAADGSGKQVLDLTANVEDLLKSGGDNALADLFGPFEGRANEVLVALREVGFGIDDVSGALADGKAGADQVRVALTEAFDPETAKVFTADFVKAQGQFEESAKQALLVTTDLTEAEQTRLDGLVDNVDTTTGYAALLGEVNVRLANVTDATIAAAEAQSNIGSITGALVATNQQANDSWVALALGIAAGTIGIEDYASAAALLNVDDVGAFADAVKASIQSFVDTATSQLPLASAAFGDLNNDAKVTGEEIKASFTKIITDSLQFGAVINRLAKEGFVNLAAAVAEQGPAAAAAVADLFKNAPEKIPQLEALAKGARESIDAASDAVTEVAPEIVAKTGILADDMEAEFQVDFAGATAKGLLEAFALFDKVDVPPGVKQAGQAIGEALAAGLAEGAKGADGAGADLIDEVERGARRQGEIFSPSRLFASLGRDIVAGLAAGLNERDELAAAGRTMIESLHTEVSRFSAQIAPLSVPAPLDARVLEQAAPTALAPAVAGPALLVDGPLVGNVTNEQTAFEVSRELAWLLSP